MFEFPMSVMFVPSLNSITLISPGNAFFWMEKKLKLTAAVINVTAATK